MKKNRHAKIVELIENYDVETQEELAEKLRQEGYENILAYGVCFYRKECAVAIQEDVR